MIDNKENAPFNHYARRSFISRTMSSVIGLTILGKMDIASGKNINKTQESFTIPGKKKEFTVGEIIQLIIKQVPRAPFPKTVDTLKSGSDSSVVNGIVTCMFPTVDIIEEAIKIKANFIIAHEPTFYNHTDDVNYVKGSKVVLAKKKLLLSSGISVWRFHDYWHAFRPDGILYGVARAAGWLQYLEGSNKILHIPALSLGQLADHLKQSLQIEHLRLIGDLNQSCSKIALIPGAAGGQTQIALIEKENPDVLIVGEVSEWETAEYIRDSRKFGNKTALIVLGHEASEDPGMEYLVSWLKPKVANISVTHISSGNPFLWV